MADGAKRGEWTQKWVAEQIGASVESIRLWEKGHEPGIVNQKKLVKLFGRPWEELWP